MRVSRRGATAFSTPFDALRWWVETFLELSLHPRESTDSDTPVLERLSGLSRQTLPEVLQAFEQVRHGEVQHVSEAIESLSEGVRGLSSVFHEWLGQERALDRKAAESLLRIGRGLSAGDSLQVRAAANGLVMLVGELLTTRDGLKEQRLRVLKAHVARIENQLAVQLGPYQPDAETGLPQGEVLREQLGFLATVGGLADHPPSLHVYRLTDAGSPEARSRLVAELLRVFFAKEELVARQDAGTFAAVSVGRSASWAQRLTERVHTAWLEAEDTTGDLFAATATLVPPESGVEWWERACLSLAEGRADRPLFSAIPASFEEP